MIGSFVTGQGTSVVTGSDSVETATGLCAPAPELFMTDAASLVTGQYAVVTAAQPPDCGGPTPPPTPPGNPLFWFKADAGITKDGANRVSLWLDQTPNHFNVAEGTSFNQPVWTPNVVNGLPGLDWGTWGGTPTTSRDLIYNPGPGHPGLPCAASAPRQLHVLCRPNSAVGGILCTFRLSAVDLEWMVWAVNGFQVVGIDRSSHFWDRGTDVGNPIVVDYTNQDVIFSYVLHADGSMDFAVNGVIGPTFFFPGPHFDPDGGISGFSLGYAAAPAYTGASWSGMITEEICWLGDSPATFAGAVAYLKARSGIP